MEKLYIDPVEKVVLARSYDVERDWLLNAYKALGSREEPLTDEEGARLGLRTVIKIAKAREMIRSSSQISSGYMFSGGRSRSRSRSSTRLVETHVDTTIQIIRDIFDL